MSVHISPIANSITHDNGTNFSVKRLELEKFEGFQSAIKGLDHFYMTGPTFAPHPHAGFSAISYLFEDSEGKLRNRDSLGNDFIAKAGELIWSQAGNGIIHDELPEYVGKTVHGIQLFINLSSKHKHIPPQVFHLKNEEIPTAKNQDNTSVRILSGEYQEVKSPIQPAEDVDFFDIHLERKMTYTVQENWNVTVYVLSGALEIKSKKNTQTITLNNDQAICIQTIDEEVKLEFVSTQSPAQLLLIASPSQSEPIAIYGPFIMNSEAELKDAYDRYRFGQMGKLIKL